MSLVRRNIIANYFGTAWTALMSLLFIPLYIKLMGIEAFGLIGIFTTLQAAITLFDLGLSQTLNRELARLSIQPDNAQEMRNLVRTLEIIYWLIALVIGFVVLLLAPFIARQWVKPAQLSPGEIQQAIFLIGLTLTLQWPISFYSGGLMGLEQQVTLNFVSVGVATLRSVGAILILWLISPTIHAFFIWQALTSALMTFLVALALWLKLPSTDVSPRFQLTILQNVWRFAAGLSGISVLILIITQSDKIILSKLLTLEMFGYYTLASALAANLNRLIGPFSTAIFPRLTQLVTQNNQEVLRNFYHRSCQFISVLILPTAILGALFATDILYLWTQDVLIVAHTSLLFSLLVIGTALNSLMSLPYTLQLAYGWTRLTFNMNLFLVFILVPALIWLTSTYGVLAAPVLWIFLNTFYLVIGIQLMHRRLLTGELKRWYLEDFGQPFVAVLVVAVLGRFLIHKEIPPLLLLLDLSLLFAATLSVAVLATPLVRRWAFAQLAKIKVTIW